MIKAIRLTLHIAHTKPFLDSLDLPVPNNDDSGSYEPRHRNPDSIPDEIAAWIRQNGRSP
ncbi:hypothetical protein BDQ12DRAFT_728522 [Crucibulum laeve]|uniref:Uncharacterized protein n=1 Tax=Crucibulum laeve TaxID=68775 RepID=A0A5C3LL32_9AGAR|nr:hypothetical protein BDQ12DRAFT_728522 [Crucibulum laeve]